MIRTLIFFIQYRLIRSYNEWIFYLQKTPVLGKHIPNTWYRSKFLLRWGTPLALLYQLISNVITNSLFIALFGLVLPTYAHHIVSSEKILFTQIGLFYISMVMVIMSSTYEFYSVYENSEEQYMQIKILRVHPRMYSLARDVIKYLPKMVGFSMSMLFFQSIFKIHLLEVISFIVFVVGFRLFIRSFYLYLFKNNYSFGGKFAIIISLVNVLLGLILVAVGTFFEVNWMYRMFFSVYFLPLGLTLLLLAIIFTLKTTYLEHFILKSLNMSELIDAKQFDEEVNTLSARVDEEKIQVTTPNDSNDQGINYIHKIFYDRVHQVFKKKIIFRIGLILLGFFVFLLLKYLNILSDQSMQPVTKFMPLLILLFGRALYLGEFFTQTTFYYMDSKLLRFRFYRTKENIKTSMIFRLKQLLLYNLPQFLVLTFSLLLSYYLVGISDRNSLFILIMSSISSYLFMTFHFLFAYYMFQPFTQQMNIKSPFYTGVITFFNYTLYIGFTAFASFVEYLILGFSLFVILYIILGIYAVYLFGAKRFKLR